jgi:hypothetical protein
MRIPLALALAALVISGCNKSDDASASGPKKDGSGTETTSSPSRPDGKKDDAKKEPAKVTRKVLYPEKKGMIATYLCECRKKEWTQPAEEEKLCIEFCGGKMPECGSLVKEEAAPK